MAIYACGDSHVRSFRLIADRIVELGGMPFHAVGQFGIPNTLQVASGDHVLFCFGEVDIRVHLPKLAQQEGNSVPAVIARVIARYVERIRAFSQERGTHGYIIAAPPQAVPTNPEAVVPVVDTIADRIERTVLVNQHLERLCDDQVRLIDMWGPWRNPDGSLNMDLSDGIVHIADHQHHIVREIVLPHLKIQGNT